MRENIEYFRWKINSARDSNMWYTDFNVSEKDFKSLEEILNFAEKCYNKMVSKDDMGSKGNT